jgi:formylglycine-generating enzyme required for sulfatase activity
MRNLASELRRERARLARYGVLSMLVLGLLVGLTGSPGRLPVATGQDQSGEGLWQFETSLLRMAAGQETQRALRLDTLAMRRLLDGAPVEAYREADDRRAELPLPMPDGSLRRFRIEESPVVDESLAASYPEIKTYTGYAIDDRATTMRCDLTPQGFHATVIQSDYSVISIHPVSPAAGEAENVAAARYVTESGFTADGRSQTLQCNVQRVNQALKVAAPEFLSRNLQTGGTLRRYRIAIAATWEYSNTFGGGNTANTVASIVTWLNAVNLIYERELTVRLILVNEPRIIYSAQRKFTADSDPFTNGNNKKMLDELGPVLASIPNDSFDLAHLLGMGSGGVAYLGSACQGTRTYNGGPINRGVTSVSESVGNRVDLRLFAHELGHQFGAGHSFNGTYGECNGERDPNSAREPGSGMTIMSYAGACGWENTDVQMSGFFHLGSLREMNAYIAGTGRCFTSASTGNNPPTVNAGPDYTIPHNTPFELSATGSDPDDADIRNLTWSWEQTDAARTFSNPPYRDDMDPVTTVRPIFRVYSPTRSETRVFPSLTYILNNANQPPPTSGGLQVAEILPQVERSLNFGVVLRDNRAGGGGVAEDRVFLTVAGSAGPFQVTWPITAVTINAGSTQTVTWRVANTNLAPVNTSQVRIRLSTDGGNTFRTTLLAATPNDGSETVTFPCNITTNTARVRVEAIGNIYFDVSDVEFRIQAPPPVAAPAGLTATTISPTQINLRWTDAATCETGYRISRRLTSEKQWTILETLPANATSYNNTDLAAAAGYTYQVCAIAPGNGALSCAPNVMRVGFMAFNFTTASVSANGVVKKFPGVSAQQYVDDLGDEVKLEMVVIPGGSFTMGSPESQYGSERPQRVVNIKRSFAMGKYEVTNAQWRAVMGTAPNWLPKNYPKIAISWDEVQEFCRRLNARLGLSGSAGYRLPSEAEWEYAARAGTMTPFAFGVTINADIVNYRGSFPYGNAPVGINRDSPIEVGSLGVANGWGLYDMHGNVTEWCEDDWHGSYTGAPVNGSAWVDTPRAAFRVIRGGSWSNDAVSCRSAGRFWGTPGIRDGGLGFRLSRTLP